MSAVTANAASSRARDSSRVPSRPINVTLAPCCASALAMAEPIPRPPPVTTACLPLKAPSDIDRHLRRSRQIPFELLLSIEILRRPGHRAVAELRRRVQSPERIGEMRPGQGAQVGAAGRDD